MGASEMRRKCPTRRSKPRFFPGVPAARRGPAEADRLADGQKIAGQMARVSYGGFRRGDA
jgi:hypothetical protein